LASIIVEGLNPERAAEELGISKATARHQLKAIFGKTATHRQSELVALLSRFQSRAILFPEKLTFELRRWSGRPSYLPRELGASAGFPSATARPDHRIGPAGRLTDPDSHVPVGSGIWRAPGMPARGRASPKRIKPAMLSPRPLSGIYY
jgi:hypothetical protein